MPTNIVRKDCFYIIILFAILLSGCGNNANNLPATYKVKPSDFKDVIFINGVIEPLKSSRVVCPPIYNCVVLKIIDDGTYVKKGDTICVLENDGLQENYDNLETKLENSKAELNKGKADMKMQYALLEAQVKTNDAETQIANLDSLQLKYISPTQRKIKELELEKAKIEKQKLQEELRSLKVIQQAEIQKEIECRSIESNVRSLVANLNSSLIRLQLLEKNVAIAEKSFAITRQRYADGDIDSQALALERDRLNTAYNSHLNAYINYQLLLADLMRKTFYNFKTNQMIQ